MQRNREKLWEGKWEWIRRIEFLLGALMTGPKRHTATHTHTQRRNSGQIHLAGGWAVFGNYIVSHDIRTSNILGGLGQLGARISGRESLGDDGWALVFCFLLSPFDMNVLFSCKRHIRLYPKPHAFLFGQSYLCYYSSHMILLSWYCFGGVWWLHFPFWFLWLFWGNPYLFSLHLYLGGSWVWIGKVRARLDFTGNFLFWRNNGNDETKHEPVRVGRSCWFWVASFDLCFVAPFLHFRM